MLKKAASAMLGPPKVSAFLHIPGFQAADCRRAWARGQQAKASASKVGQKPIGKMKDGSSVGFFMMSEQFYCYQAFSPCSPIATRFGVYFLRGWCSCLRPFSENVRFGVPVFFPLGVPVVSRCPGGVPVVPRCVPVVSRWCPSGVAVV